MSLRFHRRLTGVSVTSLLHPKTTTYFIKSFSLPPHRQRTDVVRVATSISLNKHWIVFHLPYIGSYRSIRNFRSPTSALLLSANSGYHSHINCRLYEPCGVREKSLWYDPSRRWEVVGYFIRLLWRTIESIASHLAREYVLIQLWRYWAFFQATSKSE